jgi:hypothetical protein
VFDIHQPIHDERGAEVDEARVEKYIDGLMEAFSASPEAESVIQEYDGIGWAATMMNYAFSYLGIPIPEMTVPDFNEVVFELIPRKVSTEAEVAPHIIAELRAFWGFVHRQYGSANAKKILDSLTPDAANRLKEALSNPANFGMAKSFFMMGTEAGYDMTTQEGLDAFMLAYNSSLLAERMSQLPPGPDPTGLGGIPGPGFDSPYRNKQARDKKRKARKAQRQARKRNRK